MLECPYTLPQGPEDDHVPTFWLLLEKFQSSSTLDSTNEGKVK